MRLTTKAFSLLLIGLLSISTFGVFVLADDGDRSTNAPCSTEGTMECNDVIAGCKHRSCNGTTWNDWVHFDSDDYKCATNASGGERCAHKPNSKTDLFWDLVLSTQNMYPKSIMLR